MHHHAFELILKAGSGGLSRVPIPQIFLCCTSYSMSCVIPTPALSPSRQNPLRPLVLSLRFLWHPSQLIHVNSSRYCRSWLPMWLCNITIRTIYGDQIPCSLFIRVLHLYRESCHGHCPPQSQNMPFAFVRFWSRDMPSAKVTQASAKITQHDYTYTGSDMSLFITSSLWYTRLQHSHHILLACCY